VYTHLWTYNWCDVGVVIILQISVLWTRQHARAMMNWRVQTAPVIQDIISIRKPSSASQVSQLVSDLTSLLLARDVIYTSCAYATMSVSVCLAICLWRCALWSQGAMDPGYLCMLGEMDVFANYWQRLTRIVRWDDAGTSGGRGEGSSRAILATARPSCFLRSCHVAMSVEILSTANNIRKKSFKKACNIDEQPSRTLEN